MVAQAIQFIALDLDGTLLNNHKEITENNIKAVLKVRNNRHVILISGRHIYDITGYAKQLNLGYGDYIISCDGCYIHDHNGEIIWRSPRLGIGDVRDIFKLLNKRELLVVCQNANYRILPGFFQRLREKCRMKKGGKTHIKSIGTLDLSNESCEKIIADNPQDDHIMQLLKDRYEVCYHNHIGMLDIMPLNVSKYSALCHLKDICGASSENIIYFGDSYNDIECFKHIDYSIAMENAIDEIKERAYMISKSNDEDGVCYALLKLFDISNDN